MKVILPTNTTHTIKFIPRFETSDTLSLNLVKEGINSETTQTPTYVINNGVMSLTFDLDTVEQDRYSFKLVDESDNVVYRGKIFTTSQTTQDFKLTKDTYIYV